ncbi:MAG TPA: ABC transporter ATP-binding protein [Polyangiaceae bacterium]|nr:ABC transporter ATP-binding protein [Polyangiaceae bacterium]
MKRADFDTIPVTLRGQFVRHLPSYVLGTALLALYQAAQYWFDTRLRVAIDAATSGERERALSLGAWLIVVALGSLGVRVATRLILFNAGRVAEYELRGALLGRLQRLGTGFYQRVHAGDIMSRATNDLTHVRLLLGFGVLNAFSTPFALVSAFAAMMSVSPQLTWAAMAPIPVLFLVTRSFSAQMYPRQRENQEALGALSDTVQAHVAGARVVRSFNLEQQQLEDFDRINERYLDKNLSLARLRGSMGPIMQGISGVGVLIVFWYGGSLMVKGGISSGGLLLFFRSLARLTWPLMALGFLVGLLQRGRAAYQRLAEIYQAVPDIVDGDQPAPPSVEGRLEVRDLQFSYGENQVLRGVSFELPAGGSVAIVGRTGSGKSTLARLLPRLENTPPGTVFLDGVDICRLPLSTVRKAIGYAQQNPFLFSTTAARNIGLALPECDSDEAQDRIASAARRAHVLEELLGLPEGIDTVVGERGVQLSGGQKQRVALAAAFVLGPRLLVLDDPLSAVDARTETGILEAIDEQRAERGVILITHRVAAARRCDRILVVDQGRVVESGSHEELLRVPGGIYRAFAEEQRIESELSRLGELDLAEASGRLVVAQEGA